MEKIIAFGNSSYKDVAKIWLRHMSKLDLLKKVIIITLDNEIKEEISDFNINYFDAPYNIKSNGLKNL